MRDYIIVPVVEDTAKATFKRLSQSDTILHGYTRFVMPQGRTLLSKERALEFVKQHEPPPNKTHRRGTSFLLVLDSDELLFYIDHETSLPIKTVDTYIVKIDLLGTEYIYEIPTAHGDAEEYALADLYSRVGDSVRKAFVVSVLKTKRNTSEVRGPF